MGGRVLIVDDEADLAALLRVALRRRGYDAESVGSGAEALTWLETNPTDIVLTHHRMPMMSGIELCRTLRTTYPGILTILITGDGLIDSAIAVVRAGAYDFLTKPIDLEALVLAIERGLAQVMLTRELHRLRDAHDAPPSPLAIVGGSPAVVAMISMIRQVAQSDVSVLVVGESGTGKELVARAIHDMSPRRQHPFVAINCAALPPPLLESELFGHVKGAFTDARRSRVGLFAQADKGTILLDEVTEMPLEMQAKLLRVLQDRRVRPVGDDEERSFDARLVCSTNRSIEEAVAARLFREDLYHRINVVQIPVPPLRKRGADVLVLAHHFIRRIALRTHKAVRGLTPEAARALGEYEWPGNVRELENAIERAIALTNADELSIQDLPARVQRDRASHGLPGVNELIPLADLEARYIRQVMRAVGGNKAMAARILGIDRRSLYRRLDGDGDDAM